MKQLLHTMLLFTLITQAGFLFAHAEHGDISGQTAKQVAGKTVKQMTFKDMGYQAGKLDESWKDIEVSDIEITEFSNGYYLLRITNQESNQAVYMKVAVSGQVLGAWDSDNF